MAKTRTIDDALRELKQIRGLPPDWNDNDAPMFSDDLVDRARRLVSKLPLVPIAAPSARPSIWLEYRDKDRGCLAFELFEDGAIEAYRRDIDWNTEKRVIDEDTAAEIVRMFWENGRP